MDWLNYHHLYYFWTIVKEGTIARAAEQLHLTRPTVTGQMRELEKAVGHKLFDKKGRRLVPTEFGQHVFNYAEEIFSIGQELKEFVKTGTQQSPRHRFVVGIPDVVPKLIGFELLRPALQMDERPRMICREGKLVDLLADLAAHKLDVILSDSPAPATFEVRVFSHKLGDCGLSLLAAPEMASQYRDNFPRSLHGAPCLFPTDQTAVRRSLDRWLDEQGVFPNLIAEFDDSALIKVFGQSGEGLFPVPTAIETQVIKQYGVQLVGRISEVRDKFYAISIERRVQHPAVRAIFKQARSRLFEHG